VKNMVLLGRNAMSHGLSSLDTSTVATALERSLGVGNVVCQSVCRRSGEAQEAQRSKACSSFVPGGYLLVAPDAARGAFIVCLLKRRTKNAQRHRA
jgi:hypothetical protein